MVSSPVAKANRPPARLTPIRPADLDLAARLPLPLTSMVGREQAIATARDLLARPGAPPGSPSGSRLLTLTGPGGIGKTRLALALAADLGDRFADAVWFVPLAPIVDPALVLPAIARTLQVRETGEQSLFDRVKGVLHQREALLVLDNVEHLLAAAPLVTDLLVACPALQVVATSRVRLRLSGEQELPVAPLALPAADAPPSAAEVVRYAAVALFEARARAVRPDFAVGEADAAAVAEICRRLDGLPLAIELAAARSGHLPPPALLALLDRRLPILTDGPRDQPARHGTMRDAIAWSYDLLSPDEQSLFRRLAVFVGGFTLDAAEAVASPPHSVLDGVASLVDKSLVLQIGRADELRYGMLETIREFGLERLDAGGEAVTIRRRHALFYLALGEDLAPRLSSGDVVAALDRLSAELPNVRAALAWTLEHDEVETALRLAGGLVSFWNFRGHLAEGRRWLETALARPGAAPETRADALYAAGILAALQGDHPSAVAWGEEGLALSRRHGYAFGIGTSHLLLGITDEWRGDYDQAVASYAAAIPPLQKVGHPRWLSQALVALALLADATHAGGDAARAETLAGDALAGARPAGHAWVSAMALGVQANVATDGGDHARALRLYREVLDLYAALGDQRGTAGIIGGIAGVTLARGQPERAARLLGAARALSDAIGVVYPAHSAYFERIVARTRAHLGEVAFDAAQAAGRALSLEEALAIIAAILAEPEPPAPSAAVRHGLTAREVEVARLLVQRLTNQEIAAALSISPRTAGHHAASVLAKLGLASRREVADWATQHSLE